MMEKDTIDERLIQIADDIFNIDHIKDKSEICSNDVEDWDSIGHIRLLTAIETDFDLKIPMEEFVKFDSLKLISSYLENVLSN